MELRSKVIAKLWRFRDRASRDEIEAAADAAIAAVLDALQEPNTATLQAGADRLFGAANDDWTVDAKEVWQAMLAAFRAEALPPDSRGGR